MYSVMAKSLMDPILPSQKQMNCKFLIKFKVTVPLRRSIATNFGKMNNFMFVP